MATMTTSQILNALSESRSIQHMEQIALRIERTLLHDPYRTTLLVSEMTPEDLVDEQPELYLNHGSTDTFPR